MKKCLVILPFLFLLSIAMSSSSFVGLGNKVTLERLPQHDAHALQEGLVAHWTFDEGKGSTIRDASGKGHHGSAKNAKWVPGKINQAVL